jgi:hypothetical protein
MNIIITLFIEYFVTKFFSWINEKALSIPKYLEMKNKINIPTQNNAIKELLTFSLENTLNNKEIKKLDLNDIVASLKLNIELIYEWVLLSNKSNVSFPYYSDKIILNVYADTFIMLYNSLFYQIQAYKNNYPSLQNLLILDKLDEINNKITANYELAKETHKLINIIMQKNVVYTDEFKQIEEKITLRKFTEARSILFSLEQKILERNDTNEIEEYYQLLTDSYFLDPENQHKAVTYLEILINKTNDINKRKKRELLKYLLKHEFDILQVELDKIFNDIIIIEIDQSYYDIQLNSHILQNELNLGEIFLNENKDKIVNYPLWICRLQYYQSNIIEAKRVIDENDKYFSQLDFDIQIMKIFVLSAYFLEQLVRNTNFQNVNNLKELIPKITEIINICRDNTKMKSQLHSIMGFVYDVLGEIDKARKEYDESLMLDKCNMNTLKNYPYILINSKKKEDKENALKYIEQYLIEYPDDEPMETLFYNSLIYISPEMAVDKLEAYKGKNNDIKPYLLYAYDILYEYTKAELLIKVFLSKEKISSSEYFFMALHYELLKKYDISIEYYFKAFDCGIENYELDRTVDKLILMTTSINDLLNIQKTIGIIEKKYSFDEIILKFIDLFSYALIKINNYEKCYQYCSIAIERNIKTINVYEALFSSYYNTHNFILAFDTIETYIEEFGQPPLQYLPFIAICCIKIDKLDKAYKILKYIPQPESSDDYFLQVQFLMQIGKGNEALEMAHKAYLTFPKNRKIVELFLSFLTDNKINIPSEEINNDLYKCLSDYTKSGFKNKIVNEFYFDTKAPPEEVLKQLTNIIPNDKGLIEKMEEIDKNRLPIVFFKNIINHNMLLIHHFLITQKKYKIWFFDGILNNHIITGQEVVYIDIGSLILLDTLGLLSTLPDCFSNILISQSIFDELRNFDATIPQTKADGIFISNIDGNITISNDNIPYNELSEKVRRIIDFIKNNKAVKLVGKPLQIVNKLPAELLHLNKPHEFDMDFDIIEYAFLSNTLIMLENNFLRKLYNSLEKSPQAICVVDYIQYLLKQKRMAFNKYCQILLLMLKQNYALLPLNYKIIYNLIHNNGYIIDDSIKPIFDMFISEVYNKEYVLKNIISVILIIWNTLIHNDIKYKWTDYLIEKLIIFGKLTLSDLNIIRDNISILIHNMKSKKDFISHFNKYLKDE